MFSQKQRLAILSEESRYDYSRGLVYECDHKVVGVLFGYLSYEEKMIDQSLQQILQTYHIDEKLNLFKELESLKNEGCIDLIAVDKQYCGLGIGSKLLNEVASCAKVAKETVVD